MQGNLSKMQASLETPVKYQLPLGEHLLELNPLIGKRLTLTFNGAINCSNCGRLTKKSFSQGHCFPCMKKLASCDMCILKPETCHYHAGTCRDPGWGEANCMATHIVYLANTAGAKVGITRGTQVPTRWLDQGASQALPIFKVATRQLSGLVEVALAQHVKDKTNWRALLKSDAEPIDLIALAAELKPRIEETLSDLANQHGDTAWQALDSELVEIKFPVESYPTKIVSHNFDKNPVVEGTLQGIKGQYLIFDTGVINVRKFTSYHVSADF